jgi:hypothetical protein
MPLVGPARTRAGAPARRRRKETLVARSFVLVGVTLLASLWLGAARGAEVPSREELVQQLDELKARVAQLEASQAQAVNARDVDEVVKSVLRDAERRSRLLADNGGLTAGFDKGRFFIRSEDGNYLLMPAFIFQARFVTNWNQAGDGNTDSGFEIRRMRLIFEGHAVTPDLQYKFQWETRSNDGEIFLQDAWARYKFATKWRFQAGQFKDAIHHEEAMVDQLVLTADRSFINALIGGGNIDRIQGVMLMYDDGARLRFNLVAHDGYNTKNTNFTDTGGGSAFVGVTELDFGFSARAEYFVMGTAKQYDDFTALDNTQDLLVLGAGVDWSQGGDNDVVFHTADAQWENSTGLGVYGALLGMWRDIADPAGAGAVPQGDYYDWGGLIQAGYLLAKKCEVFGRYEYIDVDGDALAAGAEDTLHELTVGTNYYWSGHKAKITLDLSWLPSGSPVALPALGVLAGDDDQFILRAQFQLVL